MKKKLILLMVLAILISGVTFAAQDKKQEKSKSMKMEHKMQDKDCEKDPAGCEKIREKKMNKESKEYCDNPKGIENAAENNKGKKKGFWSRWFGWGKDDSETADNSNKMDEDQKEDEEG